MRISIALGLLMFPHMLETSSAQTTWDYVFEARDPLPGRTVAGEILAELSLSTMPASEGSLQLLDPSTPEDVFHVWFTDVNISEPLQADDTGGLQDGLFRAEVAASWCEGKLGDAWFWCDRPYPSWMENSDGLIQGQISVDGGPDRISIVNSTDSILGEWRLVCTPINALLGDLDGDESVGFPDFLLLSANFGNEVESYGAGDVTCDGTVGFDDFLALSANFGKSLAAAGQSEVQAAAFVPEPSAATCAFIAFACLTVIFCRR